MPIYRCNKCGFIALTEDVSSGVKVACGRCANPSTVFNTVFFVEKLAERYFAALREIESLKTGDKGQSAPLANSQSNITPESSQVTPLPADLDLRNTALLATAEQHQPLKKWFEARQIDAQFDYSSVDTTGFFDDAARAIGNNLGLFSELLDRIRYAYRNNHSGLNLTLSSLSQKDAQAITNLCRQFYSHTLFARFNYQKPEKNVHLTLQTVPKIRQFFEGGWLEWFALDEMLELFKTKECTFSCARGVKVTFPNEDLHEFDVMAVVNGRTPIYIECKTGEFRREIDKLLRLKKRLGIASQQFIICTTDLNDEQAAGLSAMYELTFVHPRNLATKLQAAI